MNAGLIRLLFLAEGIDEWCKLTVLFIGNIIKTSHLADV